MPGAGNPHPSLTETAASYLQLGWSVVPLWGDTRPAQAKAAAVPWSPYQRRRATIGEVERWFAGVQYAGLGIVTGAVSQLVVLDFDAPELLQAFEQALPELAQTRTVLTRRGRHLYFHLPPHVRVSSRKLTGADLLADGHYVVAPPTVIHGYEYRVGRGGLPITLDQLAVDRIHRFLERHAQRRTAAAPDTPKAASKATPAVAVSPPQPAACSCSDGHNLSAPALMPAEDDSLLTAEALVHLYRSLIRQSGRNLALFRTSCLARNHGWKYEAVVAVLAGVHASERPVGQHAAEKPKARRSEAVRTIRSAFAKPPRPPRSQDSGGLFNSIREKLLQLGQTCVVRVLEGLRLAGIKAGQFVSERTVRSVLRGLVGQHSIRRALSATTLSGQPVFERVTPPRAPSRSYAATQIRIDRQTDAYVNETKPQRSLGRPETLFRIPSPEALCQHLGVVPSGSDPVTRDDLQTAKGTRQALHRALIQRRPGTYLRKWLGDRLGVSERTLSRYNGQIADVHVVPTFTQTPLGWHNLNAIPAPQVAPPGTCLEDSTGKRWPALKGIAQKLLGQGRAVRLLVRSLNYYWCGTADPPVPAAFQLQRALDVGPPREAREPVVTFAQHIERLVRTVGVRTRPESASPQTTPAALPETGLKVAPVVNAYTKAETRRQRRRYWRPLEDTAREVLAQRVYQTLNALTPEPNGKLSLATARQWVDRYGARTVEETLRALQRRPGVRTPAGWMATVLRSTTSSG